MSEKFEKLSEEKRKAIMDACIEEFALNGYDNASTNNIVKKAGISKGILFHYFGSKKNLFLYVFDYAVEYFVKKYYLSISKQPSDLFERLIWISMEKMRMTFEEPLLGKLVYEAMLSIPKDLSEEMTQRINEVYATHMPPMFEGLDTSKFRKGVNPRKAIELVGLCLNGLADKIMKANAHKSYDEFLEQMKSTVDEFNEYMEYIKYGIYDNQGL